MPKLAANHVTKKKVIDRAKELSPDIDVRSDLFKYFLPYLQMVMFFCETFNTAFTKANIPIQLSCDNLIRQMLVGGLALKTPLIREYLSKGKTAGIVFDQQIKTDVDIMENIIEGIKTNNETLCFNHVPAPMQWGKTGMLACTSLLGPILHLITGEVYSLVPRPRLFFIFNKGGALARFKRRRF